MLPLVPHKSLRPATRFKRGLHHNIFSGGANGSVEQKDILRRERAIEGRKSGVETGVAEEDNYALEKVTVANSLLVLSSWVSTVFTAWALPQQWAIPMASRLSSLTKVS